MRHVRPVRALSFVASLILVFQLFPANSLAAGGSISGTVEDVGGSAIRDICVAVFDVVTGLRVDRTLTDANGTYVVTDLAPASYDVRFSDCVAPLDYATEWHENVRDKDLATPVTVAVDTTTQVNAALDRWGAITGSVEDVGGSAIRDICVRVFDDLGRGGGWAKTDANGRYTLKIRALLGTGSYRVRFYDCVGPNDYAPEWNDDVLQKQLATPVTVTVGHDTEVNAALARWGTITGTVEDVGGSAIRDICVRAAGHGWTHTDANGRYTLKIRSIHTRGYAVRFSDCLGPDDYAPEWNDDVRIRKLASPVIVTVGHDTEVNAALDRWGAISGLVTAAASGHPLADVCVRASDRGRGVGWTRTDSGGSYTLKVRTRPPGDGSFKVRFSDCIDSRGYIPEFYDDIPDKPHATVVTVVVGQTTSGIDAALEKFGVISGRVTDDVTTEPIADACVNVFDELGVRSIGSAGTGSDGTYTIGGLFAGTYTVRVRDCVAPTEYHVQWYRDGSNVNEADPVVVNLGSTVSHIDVALVPTTAFTLSVSTVGSGDGSVKSQPGGIDCGSDCSQDYLKGTQVTLTATPDAGSMFVSWSGACGGAGVQATVRMDADQACVAAFAGGSPTSPPPPPLPQPPAATIGSFSPEAGPPGTPIDVRGSGFTGATAVLFNGVNASFTVHSATLISAVVPAGASAGRISVVTAGGTTTSAGRFAVAHARSVTLTLGRSLYATGLLGVTDGFGACRQGMKVGIQRRSHGAWRSIAKGITASNGSYRIRLPGVAGKFRAVVLTVTLGTGDICGNDVSPPRSHR